MDDLIHWFVRLLRWLLALIVTALGLAGEGVVPPDVPRDPSFPPEKCREVPLEKRCPGVSTQVPVSPSSFVSTFSKSRS